MKINAMPPVEFLNDCFEYCDGKLLWKHRSFVAPRVNSRCAGKEAGSIGINGYKYLSVVYEGKTQKLLAHRVVYYMHNPDFDQSLFIDHIDCSPGNNRIENLRVVSTSENMKNRDATKSSKSGYKNIFKIGKKNRPWVVQISKEKYKRHHVGSFATLEEAIEARNLAQEEAGYVR